MWRTRAAIIPAVFLIVTLPGCIVIRPTTVQYRDQLDRASPRKIVAESLSRTRTAICFLDDVPGKEDRRPDWGAVHRLLRAQHDRLADISVRLNKKGEGPVDPVEVEAARTLARTTGAQMLDWAGERYPHRNPDEVLAGFAERKPLKWETSAEALEDKDGNAPPPEEVLREAQIRARLYAAALDMLVSDAPESNVRAHFEQELKAARARYDLLTVDVRRFLAGEELTVGRILADCSIGQWSKAQVRFHLPEGFPIFKRAFTTVSPDEADLMRGASRNDARAFATWRSWVSSQYEDPKEGQKWLAGGRHDQAALWLMWREIPRPCYNGPGAGVKAAEPATEDVSAVNALAAKLAAAAAPPMNEKK